uniref:DNA cytosine methyltransferase n=1 Tax=Modestobacter versicolor TaxID=429133 RepID=UPI0034DFA0FE
KYFNVPQSRERVFIVLTRNDLEMVDISPLLNETKVNKALKDIIDFDAPAQSVELVEGNYLQFSNFINLPRASDGKLINGFHNRY